MWLSAGGGEREPPAILFHFSILILLSLPDLFTLIERNRGRGLANYVEYEEQSYRPVHRYRTPMRLKARRQRIFESTDQRVHRANGDMPFTLIAQALN